MNKHPISILSSLLIIASLLTGCSSQHSEPSPKNPPIQLQPTPGTPYQTSESSTVAESPAASSDGFSLTSMSVIVSPLCSMGMMSRLMEF